MKSPMFFHCLCWFEYHSLSLFNTINSHQIPLIPIKFHELPWIPSETPTFHGYIFAHRASKRPAPHRTTSVVWSCWWRRFGWRRRAEPELKDGWKMFFLFSKNIGLHLKTFGITGNWYDLMGFTWIYWYRIYWDWHECDCTREK